MHRCDGGQNTSLVHSDNAGWYSIKSPPTETHMQMITSANHFFGTCVQHVQSGPCFHTEFPKAEHIFCD